MFFVKKIEIDKIDKKMNETYANNWLLGFMGEYSSWDDVYDGMWNDFINDELLNKYIRKWSRFKK